MKPTRRGPTPMRPQLRTLMGLLIIATAASCASTGQVGSRTLFVEVSRDPASALSVNIVIAPVRGNGTPAGDPVILGVLRSRDIASFEFDTDRMGAYRLFATSGDVMRGTDRFRISGGADASSRIFYVEPGTERIVWDLATGRLLVR